MSKIKVIEPGEKVGMKLSAAQRTLIASALSSLDDKFEQVFKATPTKEPLLFSLEDWNILSESISTAAQNATVERVEEKLTDIVVKIDQILDTHVDVSPDQMLNEVSSSVANIRPQQIATFVEWTDMWDAAAKESGIEDEPAIPLSLESAPLELLQAGLLKGIGPAKKLLSGRTLCTPAEVTAILRSLITTLKGSKPLEQMAILILIDQVMSQVDTAITEMASGNRRRAVSAKETVPAKKKVKAEAASPAKPIYQVKITLKNVSPQVCGRILTKDCSLDKLHHLIQSSMGWTNSHLHHFRIGKEYYTSQAMTDDLWGGADDDENDSTKTKLSDVVPDSGKKFRFEYEYDFGDGWNHEILVEKTVAIDTSLKYPVCIDGASACPFEDIGGPYGYMDLLAAMADPKHERREDFAEILEEGPFDPNAFEAAAATKAMQRR